MLSGETILQILNFHFSMLEISNIILLCGAILWKAVPASHVTKITNDASLLHYANNAGELY